MSDPENTKETPLSDMDREDRGGIGLTGIDLDIRNISKLTIATTVFEAVYYDIEGNILDTVKHREFFLQPNTSRAIHITEPLSHILLVIY